MELKQLSQDLSIYSEFNFDRQPVGVKYLYGRPEGVKQLDKQLALCEMLKEAQNRDTPFYITKENENCTGKLPLGWMEMPAWAEAGQIGEKFEIFQEGRANQRLYQHFYMFKPGIVNYIVFSRLDALTFEPDLLIFAAKPSQAEIILRAMTYSTGELWQPKATPVLGCSWLYVYPYETGNVNYIMTGMHFGMKAREVFPEGLVLVSVPYNWIPVVTKNLNEMKWVLPAYALGKEEWMKVEEKTYEELANG
jgi:uncharacterized protein (DUF169 family)